MNRTPLNQQPKPLTTTKKVRFQEHAEFESSRSYEDETIIDVVTLDRKEMICNRPKQQQKRQRQQQQRTICDQSFYRCDTNECCNAINSPTISITPSSSIHSLPLKRLHSTSADDHHSTPLRKYQRLGVDMPDTATAAGKPSGLVWKPKALSPTGPSITAAKNMHPLSPNLFFTDLKLGSVRSLPASANRQSAFQTVHSAKAKQDDNANELSVIKIKDQTKKSMNGNMCFTDSIKMEVIEDSSLTASSSPTVEVKKEKNKEASKQYREKRKNAIKNVFDKEEELRKKNKELTDKLKELEANTHDIQQRLASRINTKEKIKMEICRLLCRHDGKSASSTADMQLEVRVLQKVFQHVANDSPSQFHVEKAIYEVWGEFLGAKTE